MTKKIKAIVISVNYSDLLQITLPETKKCFDDILVVTTPTDALTKKVCIDNHVSYLETLAFYENGASFDKGAAINEALKGEQGWICLLDADIVIPREMINFFESKNLDSEMFYGARRYCVSTFADWEKFLEDRDKDKFEYPLDFGFGYFQMFHLSASSLKNKKYIYPRNKDAALADWVFRCYWGSFDKNLNPIGKLERIPVDVFHLGQYGVNHCGRVTDSFFSKNHHRKTHDDIFILDKISFRKILELGFSSIQQTIELIKMRNSMVLFFDTRNQLPNHIVWQFEKFKNYRYYDEYKSNQETEDADLVIVNYIENEIQLLLDTRNAKLFIVNIERISKNSPSDLIKIFNIMKINHDLIQRDGLIYWFLEKKLTKELELSPINFNL